MGGGRHRPPAERVAKITGTQPHPRLRTLQLASWTGFIVCAAGWFIIVDPQSAPRRRRRWLEGLFLILAAGRRWPGWRAGFRRKM